MDQAPLDIRQDFAAQTAEEWLAKLNADLKGKSADSLQWQIMPGLSVAPAYFQSDLLANFDAVQNPLPGSSTVLAAAWQRPTRIRQSIPISDPEQALVLLHRLQDRGADSFEILASLKQKEATEAQLSGLAFQNPGELGAWLEQLPEHVQQLHLRTDLASLLFGDVLLQWLQKQPQRAASHSLDPLGILANSGFLGGSLDLYMDAVVGWMHSDVLQQGRWQCLSVEGWRYHEAGADASLELAIVLAAANTYIKALVERGCAVADIAAAVQLEIAVGPFYFVEIARLRALRLLWAGLLQSWGLALIEPQYSNINTRSAYRNKTRYDVHTNHLRLTTEAMAALVGGADCWLAQGIYSFDELDGWQEFAERLARNTGLVLAAESHLGQVADPAGGSWYIESLTEALAQRVWKRFQDIEARGGLLNLLQTGELQNELQAAHQSELQSVATRKRVLIGTNQYPESSQSAGDGSKAPRLTAVQLAVNSHSAGKGQLSDLVKDQSTSPAIIAGALSQAGALQVPPLTSDRLACQFEELRLQTEQKIQRGAARPAVFLYVFGHPVMRRARASFSANFFGCAGYEITDNPGFQNFEEARSALQARQYDIVVLCSSDEDYQMEGPQLLPQIKGLQAESELVIAGQLADPDTLGPVGSFTTIHARSNLLALLQDFQHRLGIASKD
ncbi:MAG: hypothetical protein KDK39_01080 [Leptospiraceae bacterium]|nr:hypothetical protein [Leptospiraceae bacterium]